jgi:hypothetical protein
MWQVTLIPSATFPVYELGKVWNFCCTLQGNGLIRHVKTCPDFFFTASIFFLIAEVTHFSVRGTAFTRGLYNPSLGCESAVLRVARCVLRCSASALLGVDVSPRVWQATILAMFSIF